MSQKISSKHTTVSDEAGVFSVKLRELEIVRITKGEATVKVLRDVDSVCRINQALAQQGYCERVEKFEGGNGVRVYQPLGDVEVATGREAVTILTADAYPEWDSARTWVELKFRPTRP